MAGAKPPNFTPEQTEVLKKVVTAMCGGNQTAIGKLLGVKQQTVSGYFAGKGYSYQTGTKIAVVAGFSGLDAMFAAHGVAPKGVAVAAEIPGLPADMPPMKRLAATRALQDGASPESILYVCTAPEWTGDSLKHHPSRWWEERIFEVDRSALAAPTPGQLAAEKGQRTRKKNAAAAAAKDARAARKKPSPSSLPPMKKQAG